MDRYATTTLKLVAFNFNGPEPQMRSGQKLRAPLFLIIVDKRESC